MVFAPKARPNIWCPKQIPKIGRPFLINSLITSIEYLPVAAATGRYSIDVIKEFIKKGLPIFGICLGHQILGLALGAKTKKMKLGHRGANHPVKNLDNGSVEITSQNHGFEIMKNSIPKNLSLIHI